MIVEQADAILLGNIRKKNMDAIITWFEQRKHLFYNTGFVFLSNTQEMEEAFYQAIVTVHNKVHRQKKDRYLEAWMASIFIKECQSISKDGLENSLLISEPSQSIIHSLSKLESHYKEHIVLAYILGFTLDEVSHILQVSIETVKSRLFTGIHLLQKESSESCTNVQGTFIDYLGKNLPRPEKVELEIHLHTCEGCRHELSAFQDTILSLSNKTDDITIPDNLIEKVKNKVAETERRKENLKRKKTKWMVVASSFACLMIFLGFVTNGFTSVYYAWEDWQQQEDELLREYYKSGLGERLNLEKESNGVKVTIKSAIADEFQTLIYYEIEDTTGENQYMMNPYNDGITIENQHKLTNSDLIHQYFINILREKEKNKNKQVYKGTISLSPIVSDQETLEVRVTQLQKVVDDSSIGIGAYAEMDYTSGDWHFNIPVKKHSSIEHKLDQEVEIDGTPIKFEKLTIAPTITLLEYSLHSGEENMRIQGIQFDRLESKKKNAQFNGDISSNLFNGDRMTAQASFEPLYFDKLHELNVHFFSMQSSTDHFKSFEIDVSEGFPQSFQYLGNNISIERITVGNPTEIIITEEFSESRTYDQLDFEITPENEKNNFRTELSNWEYSYYDKNGNKYEEDEITYDFDTFFKLRFIPTRHEINYTYDNSDESFIPKKLKINRYIQTKYLDDVVNISID
ncbi:DUF4179 domain-containing protein [Bacillus spongiae]|uniref:DUF4179 domain-containing protein n=1 Tax=Bacillus spongiae TaxID=2683610 RepID=A0ABU8H8P5_9BACI